MCAARIVTGGEGLVVQLRAEVPGMGVTNPPFCSILPAAVT